MLLQKMLRHDDISKWASAIASSLIVALIFIIASNGFESIRSLAPLMVGVGLLSYYLRKLQMGIGISNLGE